MILGVEYRKLLCKVYADNTINITVEQYWQFSSQNAVNVFNPLGLFYTAYIPPPVVMSCCSAWKRHQGRQGTFPMHPFPLWFLEKGDSVRWIIFHNILNKCATACVAYGRKRYSPECLTPTVRGSGGPFLQWEALYWHGLAPYVSLEERVISNQYKIVLSDHLCAMMKQFYLDGSGLFQDDSVPIRGHWRVWWVWKWWESYVMSFTDYRFQPREILDGRVRQNFSTPWWMVFISPVEFKNSLGWNCWPPEL